MNHWHFAVIASPVMATLKGVFDFIKGNVVYGWVFDPDQLQTRLMVQVYINGQFVSEGLADFYRSDLHTLGAGDGCHGFQIPLPDGWLRGQDVLFEVRTSTGVPLYQMPRRLKLPSLVFQPVEPPSLPYPVHLALCTIVRNEAPYLLEWIAWHCLLGVQRFVMFDNSSDDGTTELLAALARSGLVDHVIWPDIEGMGVQQPAYVAGLARLGNRCRWVGFIDADEFLNPLRGETLPTILADFDKAAGLVVPWRLYGSNGQLTSSDDLVISRFTRRGHATHPLNSYVKTIVQPRLVVRPDIHTPEIKEGSLVDETGAVVGIDEIADHHTVPDATRLVLNHYFCKSVQEWQRKRQRGKATDAVGTPEWQRHDHEFVSHDVNDVEDLSLARYAPAVLAQIDKLRLLMQQTQERAHADK